MENMQPEEGTIGVQLRISLNNVSSDDLVKIHQEIKRWASQYGDNTVTLTAGEPRPTLRPRVRNMR